MAFTVAIIFLPFKNLKIFTLVFYLLFFWLSVEEKNLVTNSHLTLLPRISLGIKEIPSYSLFFTVCWGLTISFSLRHKLTSSNSKAHKLTYKKVKSFDFYAIRSLEKIGFYKLKNKSVNSFA